MEMVLWILTALCLFFGIVMVISPGGFMRVSRTVDKRYSTDGLRQLLDKQISTEKLAELLERYIDINDKLLRFARVIGAFALIVGIFLLLIVLKLS